MLLPRKKILIYANLERLFADMYYREFTPAGFLKDYIQSYFVCETEIPVFTEDKVFATGCLEIMFNLGAEGPQQIKNGNLIRQPDIQLWGQTIQPFTFASFGRHCMLGIRFFTHTAACFFEQPVGEFNDQVIDFKDIGGKNVALLHAKLLEAVSINRRIELLEEFLLQKLARSINKFKRLKLVSNIMQEMNRDDFFESINSVSSRYGVSSRYLQKIFFDYSGLTPHLFSKINRFQKSLHLVAGNEGSLTTIAHACGYFDQSHFIKDFKFFTGSTPSRFSPEGSSDLLAVLQN